ncbi:biliverdin-producing heme oxygenase [Aeoliella sp.]|uniref:biliverdin-producing heme oxygenase n=1 Tax=Aeoliella sp. TaxID=2795800 RepID=UPI003CCBE22D
MSKSVSYSTEGEGQNTAPHAILKHATARAHTELEARADWDMVLSSKEAYANLLQRLLFLNEAADQSLDRWLGGSVAWLHERRNAAWIREDLRHFNSGPASHDSCFSTTGATLEHVNSRAAAVGVLYVMEGSSLGAMVIAQRLNVDLELTATSGAKYFCGYGHNTRKIWKRTVSTIDAVLSQEQLIDEAITSANETFDLHRELLEDCAHA